MWSITTGVTDKHELLLPFLWRNLCCKISWPADNMKKCVGVHFGDRVKCVWVCLCHRVWTPYVHCLTAVPTFHTREEKKRIGKKKKERKKVVYFRMSGFRPSSSMNAAAYKLRGEARRLPGWELFFSWTWEWDRADCLCLSWEAHLREIGLVHIKQSSKRCVCVVLLWKHEHQAVELLKHGAGNQHFLPCTIFTPGRRIWLCFFLWRLMMVVKAAQHQSTNPSRSSLPWQKFKVRSFSPSDQASHLQLGSFCWKLTVWLTSSTVALVVV